MFKLHRRTISRILITLTILNTPADVNGKIQMSYGVAEKVCTSSAKFTATNQIEHSAKVSSVNDNDSPCKALAWNHQCGQKKNDDPCKKFKLNSCSQTIITKTGTESGAASEQTSTSKNQKSSRIVNGADAQPHEYPYIVKIIVNNKFLCGGTIFNENYIITAAHCVQPMANFTVNNYVVYAGAHTSKGNGSAVQVRTQKMVIPHFAYNSYTQDNNIALLELDRPLEFSDIVFPPRLPDKHYGDIGVGKVGTIVGWGLMDSNKTSPLFPHVLQTAEVPIISYQDCKDLFEQPIGTNLFPSVAICAGIPERGYCFGDSGGPLVLRSEDNCDLFIGITSFSRGCEERVPIAFVPVAHYRHWINLNAV